jgi:urea carboxylase
LGGFVCPATVVRAELWKMGQLSPGNTVRFIPLTLDQANALAADHNKALEPVKGVAAPESSPRSLPNAAVLHISPAQEGGVAVVYRRSGDCNVLIEFGDLILDLPLRFRVHALMKQLQDQRTARTLAGIIDLTPGIRSLQVHYDPEVISLGSLMDRLLAIDAGSAALADIEVPSRTVWLPLSWDDAATRLAVEKYMQSVRADAPWCPSNIEFIRRMNGLDDWQAVYDIVFKASYMVLGLGDVYLGAPVATPLDPRHRLVTTKYNPARTWTPENAVGIGGAYLCVYGMEGPGGYQFVGRTVQMWNRWRVTREFEQGTPWLLRFFDQIRFYPVSADELLTLRKDFVAGRSPLKIEDGMFRLSEYQSWLEDNNASISAFKNRQQTAFEAERERWRMAGLSETPDDSSAADTTGQDTTLEAFDGEIVASQVSGGVWSVLAKAGATVKAGDALLVVESMKMEITVFAPSDGVVHQVLCSEGQPVSAGQALVLLREAIAP